MNLSLLPVEPVASTDLAAPAASGSEAGADGETSFLNAFLDAQNRQVPAGKSAMAAGKQQGSDAAQDNNSIENIGLELVLQTSDEAAIAAGEASAQDDDAVVADAGPDADTHNGDDAALQALLAAGAPTGATSTGTSTGHPGEKLAGSAATAGDPAAGTGRSGGKDLPLAVHDQSARRTPDVEAALQALEPLPADADLLVDLGKSLPGDDLLAFRDALKQVMPGLKDGMSRRTAAAPLPVQAPGAAATAELAAGKSWSATGDAGAEAGLLAGEGVDISDALAPAASAPARAAAASTSNAPNLSMLSTGKTAPVGIAASANPASVETLSESGAETAIAGGMSASSSAPLVAAADSTVHAAGAGDALAADEGLSASEILSARKSAADGNEPELAADTADDLLTRSTTTAAATSREPALATAGRSEAVAATSSGPAPGAELAASLTTTATARADKTAAVSVPLALHAPHFDELLSNQVYWQASQKLQSAEIRLDPPELGPLAVRITQQGSETQIQFTVSHAQTREQLEQALPRLRELFESGGLQLTQVDVQDGRRGQPERREAGDLPQFARSRGKDEAEPAAAASERSRPLAKTYSLIDTYA